MSKELLAEIFGEANTIHNKSGGIIFSKFILHYIPELREAMGIAMVRDDTNKNPRVSYSPASMAKLRKWLVQKGHLKVTHSKEKPDLPIYDFVDHGFGGIYGRSLWFRSAFKGQAFFRLCEFEPLDDPQEVKVLDHRKNPPKESDE